MAGGVGGEEIAAGQPGAPAAPAQPGTAAVDIAYFTDPLCSWSWAFEPQWRRLRYEFGQQVAWRYRMGGMLADWESFSDPLNAVANPAQMGLQWHQVREASGMPFDERIWREDPPASSYPACLAVKAAELQGPDCAEHYLRRLREAVMLERRNIARQDVLLALAAELAGDAPAGGALDADRFARDLAGAEALDAFREGYQDGALPGHRPLPHHDPAPRRRARRHHRRLPALRRAA